MNVIYYLVSGIFGYFFAEGSDCCFFIVPPFLFATFPLVGIDWLPSSRLIFFESCFRRDSLRDFDFTDTIGLVETIGLGALLDCIGTVPKPTAALVDSFFMGFV